MISRLISRDTQVLLATWACGLAVCGALSGVAVLTPALLVPFLGLIVLPALLACVAFLLYAVPSLVYLLLAQTGAPRHSGLLFLPLNPMRNIGIIRATFQYIRFCADVIPGFVWNMARYLLWERMLVKAREMSSTEGDVGELWDGFAVFGILYTPTLKLDVYLPPFNALSSPRPRAPDIDTACDLSNPPSPAPAPASRSASVQAAAQRGRPIIVFIYDVGLMGPIRLRRWMLALLGTRLAAMGYVLVIPDISTYPPGDARSMVEDLRRVLSWVNTNINQHGGDPAQIYIMGHGLGAHLALYTLAQQNIITAIRRRDARRAKLFNRLIRQTDKDSEWETFSYFSPEAPMLASPTPTKWRRGKGKMVAPGTGLSKVSRVEAVTDEDQAEAGLREMGIYGEEIVVPVVKGVIMLSPVTDAIKQIKHESTTYLEHISPLRRTLGPSQAMCMRHSLGHLLFAGKHILDAKRMPKVLIIHGAQDTITPLDHAHWLHELLHGLDVASVFRPYRNMTHWGSVLGLMCGSKGEYTDWLEKDVTSFVTPDSMHHE